MMFMNVSLDDRIHRAALFAKATENTFCQIDVIACSTACTILTLMRLDGNCHCRTFRLTKLTGNATLFTIRITTQGMQPTESWRRRCFFYRVIQSDFSAEKIASCQAYAFAHLCEQLTAKKIFNCFHSCPRALLPNVPGRLHPNRNHDQPHTS